MKKLINMKKKNKADNINITYTTGDPALNATKFNMPFTARQQQITEDKISIPSNFETDTTEVELPAEIKLLSKKAVEDTLISLEPFETFTIGYVRALEAYKNMKRVPHPEEFYIIKLTELECYTGVDFIEANIADKTHFDARKELAKKQAQIDYAQDNTAVGPDGTHKVQDFSADYAVTNKIINASANTLKNRILAYAIPNTKPRISYYLLRKNISSEWLGPLNQQIVDNLLITSLENTLKADPNISATKASDIMIKFKAKLDKANKTSEYTQLTGTQQDETRSRFDSGTVHRDNVRTFFIDQLYYLKTKDKKLGSPFNWYGNTKVITKEALSKELQEAKRYVRRYYIKPQNIFCSNKTDILQTLISIEDQDCVIYTLNNLGDIKDVSKLTSKDIIYFYENGILYDKNYLKIMDYDLYIKHEEKRKNIDIDKATDLKLANIYSDRITGFKDLNESAETHILDLNFPSPLNNKSTKKVCLYCGSLYSPKKSTDMCCQSCARKNKFS